MIASNWFLWLEEESNKSMDVEREKGEGRKDLVESPNLLFRHSSRSLSVTLNVGLFRERLLLVCQKREDSRFFSRGRMDNPFPTPSSGPILVTEVDLRKLEDFKLHPFIIFLPQIKGLRDLYDKFFCPQ